MDLRRMPHFSVFMVSGTHTPHLPWAYSCPQRLFFSSLWDLPCNASHPPLPSRTWRHHTNVIITSSQCQLFRPNLSLIYPCHWVNASFTTVLGRKGRSPRKRKANWRDSSVGRARTPEPKRSRCICNPTGGRQNSQEAAGPASRTHSGTLQSDPHLKQGKRPRATPKLYSDLHMYAMTHV